MLFSSITFLYYFLPATLLVYLIVPKKWKNFVILLASLFFYWWGEPKYLALMIFAIIQGYIWGLLIEKARIKKAVTQSKLLFFASIFVSLGMLAIFKYLNFFVENYNFLTNQSIKIYHIALPIGISFYTFQIISYLIEVYRGNIESQKNIIHFATYVAMFPQLIAGPIVRYCDIAKQLTERTQSVSDIAEGLRRFMIGLSKKVLIANVLGELVTIFHQSDEKSIVFIWTYAIAYALQIYFDFSGYSDMAIGLGKMFGFSFPENFRYPYMATSITEFWRRWHISLGTWFRDYLYIPLGGNRVSKKRHVFNIVIVWMATGFWHGAAWNFIVWGLWFAILLLLEKNFLNKEGKNRIRLGHFYVILCVLISFIIFDHTNLYEGFTTIGQMFGLGAVPSINAESIYYLRSYVVVITIGIIGATPLVKNTMGKLKKYHFVNVVFYVAEPIFLVILFLVATAFLIDGSYNPFLYFRF